MRTLEKLVVFGATGVVGLTAARHFSSLPDVEVVAVSRRPPGLAGVEHVPVDLSDESATSEALRSRSFDGVSHAVYAALQESDDLVAGWLDPALMRHNLTLFRNAVGPLAALHGSSLRHVSLLQGAKAYGLHLGLNPLPAKERQQRVEHDNFYFLQEDALREFAFRGDWSWTILRPQVVYGESVGSPMNLLPAIGVYAAVEKAQGRPLVFPGGPPGIQEGVDARLLARALEWAATSHDADDDVFNVTNGDVFCWQDVWPTLADVFGMEAGRSEPRLLALDMPARAGEWAAVVDQHRLSAPRDMGEFVGNAWSYADLLFGTGRSRTLPAMLSTVKIRQAGFADCIDSEDMLVDWFQQMQNRRLIPRLD